MPDEARLAARAAALTQKQWPLIVVLLVVLTGLAMVAWWSWPLGLTVFAGGLLLAALLRLVLPRREVGLLAVRGRIFDVVFLVICGAGLLLLVLSRI